MHARYQMAGAGCDSYVLGRYTTRSLDKFQLHKLCHNPCGLPVQKSLKGNVANDIEK